MTGVVEEDCGNADSCRQKILIRLEIIITYEVKL